MGSNTLLEIGLPSSLLHSYQWVIRHPKMNYSLLYKKSGTSVVYLAIYVEDILVVGNDDAEINFITYFLDSTFKIKDLGTLHYFLGLEFTSVPNDMVVSQNKFTHDLLQEFNCSYLSPVVSPLDLSSKLLPGVGELYHDPSQYRKLVGKLNFLTHTRPDLAFAVQHLSQYILHQEYLIGRLLYMFFDI